MRGADINAFSASFFFDDVALRAAEDLAEWMGMDSYEFFDMQIDNPDEFRRRLREAK